MSTISSISASSNWSTVQSPRRPPDGGQKMAEELFSKLDTSGQGYLQKSDLQAALDKTSSSSSSASSSTSNIDQLFTKLDSNGDDKVTQEEFTDALKQIQSQIETNSGMQGANNMPPPPPPPPNGSNSGDAGFTKDDLKSQLSEIGSSDSKRSDLINKIVNNFDKADTDGDGKVSMKEAQAYDQSNSSSSTSASSTNASTSDSSSSADDTAAKIMYQVKQLMQAYGSDSYSNSSGSLSLFA